MKKLCCLVLLCLMAAGLFAKSAGKLYVGFNYDWVRGTFINTGDDIPVQGCVEKDTADAALKKTEASVRKYFASKGIETGDFNPYSKKRNYPFFYLDRSLEAGTESSIAYNWSVHPHVLMVTLYYQNSENEECIQRQLCLIADRVTSADDLENITTKFAKQFLDYCLSPAANAKASARRTPELLDERYVPALTPQSIAIRDDYSFVLSAMESVTDYSATWELRQNLDSKLGGQVPYTSSWQPACIDGRRILLANQTSPSVMCLDTDGSISRTGQYNFPHGNLTMRFLKDGEPYLVDLNNRSFYFPSKDGRPADKFDEPLDYIMTFKPGIGDELWFQTVGYIVKYSKSSGLKSFMFLPDATWEMMQQVLDDGSFITVDYGSRLVRRRSADGKLLWTYQLPDKYKNSVFYAGRNGMYFFHDSNSKLMWRLVESDVKLPGALAVLKANSGKLEGANLKELARIYCENADALYKDKSYSNALSYYSKYLEISPADSAVAERKLMCEVALGKKEASEKSEKALALLDEYGEATAQSEYSEAMMTLEKLRRQVPWDEDVQAMYAELKSAFNPGEAAAKEDKTSLSVDSVELSVLFPALMNVYATNPAGFINVRNTGKSPVKNLKVSAYVRKYMDFASEGDTVATLKGGASAPVEIRTVLNQKVLSLNENTVLQMQLTLSWEEDGRKKSTTMTRPVTVYKKSAMSWRDTGMLSCFVLPNDSSVSSFAFAAMDTAGETLLSTQVTKAMRISDALGSLPLNYVADPSTPLDQVIGNEFAVDTVRFPGETLSLKGGDCDDMTTLFCSLLESTGVPSAFVTVPGHIFAAFDTGLKYNSIWKKLGADYAVLERNGHVWIPVEVTVLNKGFSEAWKTASKEIQTEGMELTELSEAWKVYASVPADGSAASVSVNKTAMSKMNNGSRDAVVRTMTRLLDEATASKMKAKDLNAAAKLYHSMGQDDKAIAVLLKATEQDSSYEALFANLATLYRKQGDSAKAELYAGKSKSVRTQVADSGAQDGSSRASSAVEEIWYE